MHGVMVRHADDASIVQPVSTSACQVESVSSNLTTRFKDVSLHVKSLLSVWIPTSYQTNLKCMNMRNLLQQFRLSPCGVKD